jgi:ubiquinone/menaquinone biosynthesis C-methylase UbiE
MNMMRSLFAALLVFCSPMLVAQQGQTEGINDSYKAPDLQIKEWTQRFESEGREAFDLRHEIVAAIGLKPGQAVADVGAGTGLFVPLLAEAVGRSGQLYAIDIAPAFINHIAGKARAAGLEQVRTVLSTERSIEMPPNSLDVIFTCDAYHHFVHYEDMLASMRRALKPGGQLIVVDFDINARGLSKSMIKHVGRSKREFSQQIQQAGFQFAEDLTLEGMKTSFMYRFVKPTLH